MMIDDELTASMPAPPMSADTLKAREIYETLQRGYSLKQARAEYRDKFGRPHDDPSIGVDYRNLIEQHFAESELRLKPWCAADVKVPAPLALAYFLRDRGVGRKGGGQYPSLAREMEEDAQMAELLRRVAGKKGDAWEDAAKELHDSWSYRGKRRKRLTVSQMLERLAHPKRFGLRRPGK